MLALIALGVMLTAWTGLLHSQPVLQWLAEYGESQPPPQGRKIILDEDGNVYAAGTRMEGIFLLKYSPSGQLLWEDLVAGENDLAGLARGADGNLLLAANNAGGVWNQAGVVHLFKYSPQGERLFDIEFDGPEGGVYFRYMALDGSGYTYLAGGAEISDSVSFPFADHDAALAKFSPDGQFLWADYYRDEIQDFLFDAAVGLAVDGEGRAAMLTTLGIPNTYVNEYRILGYGAAGDLQWEVVPEPPPGFGNLNLYHLRKDDQGNVIAGGYVLASGEEYYRPCLFKYSPLGQPLWTVVASDSASASSFNPADMEITPEGETYFLALRHGRDAFFILKFSPEGDLLWTQTYADSVWNSVSSQTNLEINNQGLYLTASYRMTGLWHEVSLAHFNHLGSLTWKAVAYTEPPQVPEVTFSASDLALGPQGRLALLIDYFDTNTPEPLLTIAFQETVTGVTPEPAARPDAFSLAAHPNPFNPSTVARYELRAASDVNLRVYDTAGREVATLVNGWRAAGSHEVTFNGAGLPSGIYLAKLTAEGRTAVQKLILMK